MACYVNSRWRVEGWSTRQNDCNPKQSVQTLRPQRTKDQGQRTKNKSPLARISLVSIIRPLPIKPHFPSLSPVPPQQDGRAMWCAKCQSEVAVEARPNSQRLHCATCGTEISPRPPRTPSQKQPPAGNPATGQTGQAPPVQGKNPHELLARWAGNQMFDPYGPLVTPESRKEIPKESRPQPPKPESKPVSHLDESAKLRIDPAFAQGWSDVPAPHVRSV